MMELILCGIVVIALMLVYALEIIEAARKVGKDEKGLPGRGSEDRG